MKNFFVRNILKILVYLSLVFFIYYLYTFDYVVLESLQIDILPFVFSVLLLFAGFLFSAISWWFILSKQNVSIGVKQGIVSHGLYVFAKYIPGKIWVILGRAGIASKFSGKPVKELSIISLKEQFIYVIMGLIIGLPALLLSFGFGFYALIIIAAILALSFMFFVKPAHNLAINVASRILRRPLELPFIGLATLLQIAGFIVVYWLLWASGFYLLLISVFGDVSITALFIFPLGVSVGVLAIILPGGIGVREGIITGLLVSSGISLEAAITVSLLQRIWFIAGEVFIFLAALFFSRKHNAT